MVWSMLGRWLLLSGSQYTHLCCCPCRWYGVCKEGGCCQAASTLTSAAAPADGIINRVCKEGGCCCLAASTLTSAAAPTDGMEYARKVAAAVWQPVHSPLLLPLQMVWSMLGRWLLLSGSQYTHLCCCPCRWYY